MSTRTAYLPREKYWSVRYRSTSSSVDWSKVLPRREADVAQRLLQVLGLDVLVAGDLEALDRWPLEHRDDQRAAVAAQLDVAEEAGGVQRAQRFLDAALVEPVADVDRQVVEDRALGDALQPLDADVADGELAGGRLCEDGRYGKEGRQGGQQYFRRIFRAAQLNKPRQVVVESETHQHEQQHDADLLADGLRALGQRAALGKLGELEDDLPAVEDRNGQQIEHEQTHAHDREERQEREHALARREYPRTPRC